jgi:hypothetical protein
MTFTNDPPIIGDIALIPGQDEKADLDAPASQSGKVVVSQIPNISISSTTVVADQNERLSLDVQEGDVAIQTDTSESYIFTGGANVNVNWQLLQFDAVGGIQGKDIDPRDITPRDVTASGDVSGQNLTVSAAFNGADLSAASAGEALTADGNGNLSFASVGGDILSQMSEFLSQSNMAQVASSLSDMQDVINTGLLENVAVSQTAMAEVGFSQTAQTEILNSNTAVSVLNSKTTSFSFSTNEFTNGARKTIPETNENYPVYIKSANYTGYTGSDTVNEGWYDADNNYLGSSIGPTFVDTLKIGWDSAPGAPLDFETISGDIEAQTF